MISFISLIMKCGRDSVSGILWCRCSCLWQALRCRFHCQSTSVCPAVTGPSIGGFWGGCFCCLFSEWLFREICLDWTAVIFISIQILCSLLLSAILLRQSFSYIFIQVADRNYFIVAFHILDSHDILGDFTPAGNFAEQVDRCVLGRFRDGVFWNEDGTWSFSPYYNYTWIWSSLTFGVTVMLGAFAGKIMKEGKANRKRWYRLCRSLVCF